MKKMFQLVLGMTVSTIIAGCEAAPKDDQEEQVEGVGSYASLGGDANPSCGPNSNEYLSIEESPVRTCGTMNVRYWNFPKAEAKPGHWIDIAEKGAPGASILYRYKYLDPSGSGTHTLSTRGLQAEGAYEVRAYLNWPKDQTFKVFASIAFGAEDGHCELPELESVTERVKFGEKITVVTSGLKKSKTNWISISLPKSLNHKFLKVKYLPADVSGSTAEISVQGLAPGKYELRLFEDWQGTKEYFIYDRKVFEVY